MSKSDPKNYDFNDYAKSLWATLQHLEADYPNARVFIYYIDHSRSVPFATKISVAPQMAKLAL